MPVAPATQGAEVGGSPESRCVRLQYVIIMPLHTSMGDRARETNNKQSKESAFIAGWRHSIYGQGSVAGAPHLPHGHEVYTMKSVNRYPLVL